MSRFKKGDRLIFQDGIVGAAIGTVRMCLHDSREGLCMRVKLDSGRCDFYPVTQSDSPRRLPDNFPSEKQRVDAGPRTL